MPSEIRITGTFEGRKGSIELPMWSFTLTADWDNPRYVERNQVISYTGWEALDIPSDLGSNPLGFIQVQNLDSTNYIELGIYVDSNYYDFAKIPAGKTSPPIPVSLTRTEIFARANAADVEIKFRATAAT